MKDYWPTVQKLNKAKERRELVIGVIALLALGFLWFSFVTWAIGSMPLQ